MYTDAMSHFLPDDDHPEYPQFEAALPEFKKRMERQYPQCCIDCEPKVQEQLQQATYHARSDNLRRVLDRSRKKTGGNLGWRSLVINGAGLICWLSLIIQLLWHAIGSQADHTVMPNLRPTDCLLRPTAGCPDMVEKYMGISLLMGVISGWWNPKWQHKLKGRSGRLIGLSGYYRAQIAVLIVRFTAWVAIRDIPTFEKYRPMLHSLSLVFIILIAGYTNLGIIKIDTKPLVDWQQKMKPLVTNEQQKTYVPTKLNNDLIQNLQSTQPRLEAWRPPTPPTDDVMDWTPSTAPFIPQPKKIIYKSTQPSPFVGTIPALPKQGIFADRSKSQLEQPKAIGIPQGFFDKRDVLKKKKSMDSTFAQPKFFPHDNDTGLEAIFGKVFSLDENVIEVRNQAKTKTNPSHVRQLWLRILTVTFMGMVIVYSTTSNCLGMEIDQQVLTWTAIVPAMNTILGFVQIDSSKIGLSLIGGMVLVGLQFIYPGQQSLLSPLWNKSVLGVMGLLLLQEIFYLFTTSNQQSSQALTQQPSRVVSQSGQQEDQPDLQQLQPTIPQATTTSQDVWGLPVVQPSPTTPRINRSRRDSIDSNTSSTSTSTSSTWKTPRVDNRMTRNVSNFNTRTGIGSLGLEDFSIGNTVAGPRRSKRGQW